VAAPKLPEVSKHGGDSGAADSLDEHLLFEYMFKLQFPETCRGKKLVQWPGGFSGYGSQISILFRSFVNGMLSGHTTVVGHGYHGRHPYVARARCPKRTITECVYRKLSNCSARDGPRLDSDSEDCSGWTMDAFNALGVRAGLKNKHSIFWYTSKMLRWLLEPNAALRAEVQRQRSKHFRNTGEKTICVHIRHGDRKESAQYGDEEYAAVINQAMYNYGFERIWMMSDDPKSYENIPALAHLPVEYLPLEYFAVVNYTGTRQHAANIVKDSQKYNPAEGITWDEALLFSAMFEIWVENCEGFIGNFKSSFPTLIYFLRQASKPFEFHFDMDKGTTPSVCMNHMHRLPMGHITHHRSGGVRGNSSTGWGKIPVWLQQKWWV